MACFTAWIRSVLSIFTCQCLKKNNCNESEEEYGINAHDTDAETSDDARVDNHFSIQTGKTTGQHSEIGEPSAFLTKDQNNDEDLKEVVNVLHASDVDIPKTHDFKTSDKEDTEQFEVFEPEIFIASTKSEVHERCNDDSVENEAQTSKMHFARQDPFSEIDVLNTVELLITKVEDNTKNDPKLIKQTEGSEYKTIQPDTMIVIDGQHFQAHKDMLCADSEYFKELLAGKNNKQCVCHIHPKSVAPEIFQCLLTFLYTGILDVSCHRMRDLYQATHYLGFKRATAKCREMLEISSNNMKNLLNLYCTAHQLQLEMPKKHALKVLAEHFESIVMEKDFLDFSAEQIIELFSQDTIGARSEIVIFLSALKWINHDFLEREQHSYDILKCVRFSNMTLEEAVACMHPPLLPGLIEKPEIRALILNAICYVSAKITKKEMFFSNLKSQHRNLLLIGKPMELWSRAAFDPKWNQDRAATKIQATFRGYKARKELSECNNWTIRMWCTTRKLKQEMAKELGQEMGDLKARSKRPAKNSVRNYRDFLKCAHEKKPMDIASLE